MESDETTQARSMLRSWAESNLWARRDLGSATIEGAHAVGPMQILLVSEFELRGIRYTMRPAPRGLAETAAPDPWSAPLTMPPGSAIGHEVSCRLEGEVGLGCMVCGRRGDMICPRCGGTGTMITTHVRGSRGHQRSERCSQCSGRGECTCGTCAGSGSLYGAPTAWARMAKSEIVRVIEAAKDELPLDVYLDLQDRDHGGEVIHRQREPHITELRLPAAGGYRASATQGPLADVARTMLASPDVPEGARMHAQELEIRRVPAFTMTIGGRAICVYGDPPAIHPERALRSMRYYAAIAAPIGTIASALVGAAIYLLFG